jgi:hypothetical protein
MKQYLMNFIIYISIIFFTSITFAKADYSVYGEVYNEKTKEAIPGATIKIKNTTKGTYSSSRGKFRIPFLKGNQTLKISSLGYYSKEISVTPDTDTLIVYLEPGTIMLRGVTKEADIEVDEVIRRAIERKQDNVKKLETFQGTLYSKLVMELGGDMFEAGSDGSGFSLSGTIGDKAPDKFKMFVMETFSEVKNDFVKNKRHVEILQRRQTSNMEAQNNLLAMGDFINFYSEEIEFLNTTMATPLSSNAFSYYDYEMLDKTILDDRYIYVIKVIPNTRTFPSFEGTIKIVEKTYNLIELDLKPSENTSITFLEGLKFVQKFSEIERDIWFPTYLYVTAKADVQVIKGLMEVKLDVNATSIYSDIQVNQELPDYIYKDRFGYDTNFGFEKDTLTGAIDSTRRYRAGDRTLLTVAKMADSTDISFWEKNSLREITEREKRMYIEVDSLVAIEDSTPQKSGSGWLPVDILPYLNFNRVASVSAGLDLDYKYDLFSINGLGYYSFGQQKPYGVLSLNFRNVLTRHLDVYASVFSDIRTVSNDDIYPMILNTAFAALFHTDYYDHFQKDGYNAGIRYRFNRFTIETEFENARHFCLDKTTDRSIFSNDLWRENPKIDDGDYRSISFGIKYGSYSPFTIGTDLQYKLQLDSKYGELSDGSNPFRWIQGSAEIEFSTFRTGYSPMKLHLKAEGGLGSKSLPLQEQFRMRNTYLINSGMGGFYSAPIAAYGGTEYWAAHAEYNLTDIWWRFLGLPTYDNRGLELILAASIGRYFSDRRVYYLQTKNDNYNEIGFGISRIPVFVSNLIFLRFDARWGVGPLGSGEFGAGIIISLPF